MQLTNHTNLLVTTVSSLLLFAAQVPAGTITSSVFATGGAVSSTSTDSIVAGDGSVWVSYQNGSDSAGASGSSTVVRYSPTGTVLHTFTIAGNVDGLRIDPSGQVWALQNNDGNSALTVINPVTNGTTSFSYGNTYTANGNSLSRGFDDVVFRNGATYLSETNPGSGTDPVILQLTTPLASPLQVAGILNSTFTGTNLATGLQGSTTITDSDSLVLSPTGDLVLTGEADQEIVFVHNPGAANQSENFLALLGTDGLTISGLPDDTVFPTAPNGTFYVTDTGANIVYAFSATGLAPGSVYVDVGKVFGSLDLTTGIVTPVFTGVSPHGATFVPTPEPASFSLAAGALLAGAVLVLGGRRRIIGRG
jgi:sugar lactone lactonase YvrE